jgi:hypothetical protein
MGPAVKQPAKTKLLSTPERRVLMPQNVWSVTA